MQNELIRLSAIKEADYRSIFENAAEGIVVMSMNGGLVLANPAFARIMGYESCEELAAVATVVGKLLFAKDDVRQAFFRDVLANEVVHAFEAEAQIKDEEVRWLSVSARIIRSKSGDPGSIQCFVGDITAKKRLEQDLKTVMREQQIIIDTANTAISLVRNRRQVWINRKTEEMFRYSREEMVNETTRKLYPSEESYERLGAEAYPVLAAGDTYETVQELVRKDGKHIWVRYNGRAIDPPDLSYGTLWLLEDITEQKEMEESLRRAHEELELRVAERTQELLKVNEELRTEITERKRAEEALQESERRYRMIVETANEGVWSMDSQFRTTFANKRMAEMLGYAPEEMLGRGVDSFMPPEQLADHAKMMESRKDGLNSIYERRFIRKNGETLWAIVSACALKDEAGRFAGSFAMFTDITVRKATEEELRRTTEKLRKGLMGTIQAMSLMVEIRDPYTAGHQKRVSRIARAVAQEMGLTADSVDGIRMAATIHDIGKMSVPAEILSKPGRLIPLEVSLIRVHPQTGYDILRDVDLPPPIAQTVLQHHERLDGSGYPQGLKGDEILLEAQIIAVADVVEAISSNRPYRPAHGIDMALEEIEKNRGVLYNSQAVDACLRLFREKSFDFE